MGALQRAIVDLIEQGKSMVKSIEDAGRVPTSEEKGKIAQLLDEAEKLKVQARINEITAGVSGPSDNGSLFEAAKSAGWEKGKKVYVDRKHLKTASFSGDADDLSPIRREGADLAFDVRYLADVFPSTGIGNEVSSVQVLRQSSRTLPAAADVQRTYLQSDEKAEVESERELVDASVGILAAIESGIPNRLLIQNGMRSMVDNDLRLSLLEAKDDAILDAINAASPDPAGTGGSDLISAIRFAIAEMSDDGIRPTVLALSSMDAAQFDLTRSSGPEEFFVFGPGAAARPPFGLRVVTSKSIEDGSPLLIEPNGALHRYEGQLSLETFEMDFGKTNQSLIRLEQSFLAHCERPAHIRIVTQGS